jgi:fructan beta-fructosidase
LQFTPDKLGYIYPGSVVVDSNNTSGFGIYGKPALVAIFTQHDTAGEHAHTTTFQNQSIAYSNDGGVTWIKFKDNPVIKNPGVSDFRDPKVMRFKPGNKWIMALAVKDQVSFYSSPDLKSWKEEGEFGKDIGRHDGVWECPDLFAFDYDGKLVWALLVSIKSGGPNGGSLLNILLAILMVKRLHLIIIMLNGLITVRITMLVLLSAIQVKENYF